jgi:hypothetical protein
MAPPPRPLAALEEVLRLSARVEPDEAHYQRLAEAAGGLDNWDDLPVAADAHGIAPLVYAHLTHAGVALPPRTEEELARLTLYHRHANHVCFRVLEEVLDAFDREGISVLVLKGAALAHVLYASTDLRPLSDVDLLVDSSQIHRAQSILGTLGFSAPSSPASRQLAGHHHLPAATRECDGYSVAVEIHRDALSRDAPGSLTTARLTGAPHRFSIGGRVTRTLGHLDMLYHLSRHLAECGSLLRLVWIADVVGYAARYHDDIPWEALRHRYPFVLNALSLLHLVTALPRELLDHVTPAQVDSLRGVGVTCKPLAAMLWRGRPWRDIRQDLFAPSDWWLRLYYELGDSSWLWWHRSVRHPVRVGRWLTRRAVSYAGWRTIGVRGRRSHTPGDENRAGERSAR